MIQLSTLRTKRKLILDKRRRFLLKGLNKYGHVRIQTLTFSSVIKSVFLLFRENCPPSMTVFVSFNLASARRRITSSTVLRPTKRMIFTGLNTTSACNHVGHRRVPCDGSPVSCPLSKHSHHVSRR